MAAQAHQQLGQLLVTDADGIDAQVESILDDLNDLETALELARIHEGDNDAA